MKATVHQPKTPFCVHCNCCFRFFWQPEQLSHFLNPTFFLIVCFKNWCHSTTLKLKLNFNTKIYCRGYNTYLVSPWLPPCSSKQVSTGLQRRALGAKAVQYVQGCFSPSLLRRRGTAWCGFLCCSFRIGSQTGHLFNITVSCFTQLLFH